MVLVDFVTKSKMGLNSRVTRKPRGNNIRSE
jgi:hypothetical protein